MQHEHHRVPVTALAFWDEHVILAGEGNLLKAYDTRSKTLLATEKLFDNQSIHGLIVSQSSVGAGVFAYGGPLACQVAVSTTADGVFTIKPGQTSDAGDWILDAAARQDSEDQIAVVTAHNALSVATCTASSDVPVKIVVEGSNCILYSANIQWLSPSKCLIASGTAFGDVIIWSCVIKQEGDDLIAVSSTHYTFSAHQGSVFGVQISSSEIASWVNGRVRLVATCSDDRTIRLWDISDLSTRSLSLTEEQRETGFGSEPSTETHAPPILAKIIGGHLSRIWHVRFIEPSETDDSVSTRLLSMVSFGEDACTIRWALVGNETSADGLPYTLRQIDSLNPHSGKNIWAVALDHHPGIASGAADGALVLQPVEVGRGHSMQGEILPCMQANGNLHDTCRAYGFVGPQELLASTDHGRVLLLSLEAGFIAEEISHSVDSLRGYSIMDSIDQLAFVAGKTGSIYAFSAHPRRLEEVMNAGRKVAGLFAHRDDHDQIVHLLVTTVGSSTGILCKLDTKTLDVVTLVDRLELQLPPGFVVTSITYVRYGSTNIAALGSRDGSVALFSTSEQECSDPCSPALLRALLHGKESVTCLSAARESGDKLYLFSTGRDGTYGAHEIDIEQGQLELVTVHQISLSFGPNIEGIGKSPNGHLRVWGFRSKQFVVFDIDEQQEIMTVDCGGAHRNWSFQMDDNGGTFVWTKASKMYRKTQEQLPFSAINSGGHGREIKATAVSPVDRTLVATGAEDTDIKLSRFVDKNFRCLHTLRKHNTGIQHLQWSSDGRYLFSSGGFEEFFVWKIADQRIPGLSLGVLCESAHPNSGTSDLRIMHFDVGVGSIDADTDCFRVWMAYSDSTIRLWQYGRASWALMSEGDYLTSCLTQCVELKDRLLLTGSTDGHLASWSMDAHSKTARWNKRQKVHQSAILSMITTKLEDNSHLLLTGGDDNAIGLTRITASGESETLLLPDAHAAAVTGLQLIGSKHSTFWLVSASIDQRLKLWRIDIDVTRPGIHGIDVKLVENVFTAVADVSSLEEVMLDDGEMGVLVCGVGMDVWRLPIRA